jgi:hypothetical protein
VLSFWKAFHEKLEYAFWLLAACARHSKQSYAETHECNEWSAEPPFMRSRIATRMKRCGWSCSVPMFPDQGIARWGRECGIFS